MSRMTTKLRQLLAQQGALLAPGAFGPMPGRLAERAGFEAIYLPGGGTALNRLGVADVGIITMTEMVDSAKSITQAVNVPVICDADSGFGNHLNLQRAVREYELAGVAAIHIEDQTFPKRSGHSAGKSLIPIEEAAQKIRAAVAARRDPDFVIIARCDAMSIGGLDEVVRRCTAYNAAGADMTFVESPNSIEAVTAIPKLIPGMHLFNMSAGGTCPVLTVEEAGQFGYKLMIMPNFSALVAIKAMREMYAEIRRTGSVATIKQSGVSFAELQELGDLARYDAADRAFGFPVPMEKS